MAGADITAQRVRELFNYDPDTGLLTFLPNKHWRVVPGSSPTGRMKTGYLRVAIERKMFLAHRVAWLHYYGEWPKHQIDHINGIKDDNRIANLRDVTDAVNQQNMRQAKANSKTGVLGVSPRDGKFVACIQTRGEFRYLGWFDTIEEASAVYLATKRRLHEGCTI